jgi:hypothetical protein
MENYKIKKYNNYITNYQLPPNMYEVTFTHDTGELLSVFVGNIQECESWWNLRKAKIILV